MVRLVFSGGAKGIEEPLVYTLVAELSDGTYTVTNVFAPCYLYFNETDSTTGVRNASLSGVLSAPDGSSLPEPVSVDFRLYDAPSGGNLLWSETRDL